MSTAEDIKLTCRQCGQEFIFTKAEQEFYKLQGFVPPRRCHHCRTSKQNQEHRPVCNQCGTEIEPGAAIYCTACLASAHLDVELATSKIKKASNEAHSKLIASEAKQAKLAESLRQQEQLVAELKQQVSGLSQDLENAYQFHNAIASLQPVLNSLDERLKSVEYAQNKINERMLQLVERVHEMYENTGLLDVLKRGLGQYRRPDAQSQR